MKPYRTVIALMLLASGCATPAPATRSDMPLQKALTGWGYVFPAGANTIFMGTTGSQSECEGLRQRTTASSMLVVPSACAPMSVTTE